MSPAPPRVALSRRPTLRTLAAIVRNPLLATPDACFREPVVSAPLFGRPRLYLTDPALIHAAYVGEAEALTKGAVVPRVLAPAFGQGLLSSEGAHWRRQRRAVAPAFAAAGLDACVPAMLAAAEAARDRLLAGPDVVDINHAMTMATFAVLADTMLSGAAGADARRYERALADYLAGTGWLAALAILGLPAGAPFPGRRRAMAAAHSLRAAVGATVARRRAEGGGGRRDLVSMLIEAADPATGTGLEDADIVDNLLTFIAAGHDTTAQALSWTLGLLAGAPEAEAAVIDEAEVAAGGGPLRPEHVPRLEAARRAFSEGMRLYPPAPLIERRAERDLDLEGLPVAAGTMLVVPIHALHRRAGLWAAPDRFDPGRFAPEAARARHRYGYMPFGAGPRSCIGAGFALLEGAAILSVLLRAVRLTPVEPALPPPVSRITLRPARPILMRVARRG